MDFKKYKIKTPKDLMTFFEKNMKYGFTYRGKVFLENADFCENMNKYYKIRLGEDFIKSGYGVCWDFCELEREFFLSQHINHECYFIEGFLNRAEGGPTHTFALFEEKGKWFWFEYSWFAQRGIWEYATKQQALKDVFHKYAQGNRIKPEDLRLYKIDKIKTRLNAEECVDHYLNGEEIDINT